MDYAAPFLTTFGCKQGGCISPDLYKIFCEIIAIEITILLKGILIGNMLVQIIMYADDITLIAESAEDMQILLNKLGEFSKTLQIKFNPSKTTLLIYNSKNDETVYLVLCGKPIIQTKDFKYIGVQVSDDYKNKKHIDKRRSAVIASLAKLTSTGIVDSQMDIATKLRLFSIYIKPLIYYGIEALTVNQSDIDELKKIEGKAVKDMIGNTSLLCDRTKHH